MCDAGKKQNRHRVCLLDIHSGSIHYKYDSLLAIFWPKGTKNPVLLAIAENCMICNQPTNNGKIFVSVEVFNLIPTATQGNISEFNWYSNVCCNKCISKVKKILDENGKRIIGEKYCPVCADFQKK